MYNHVVMMYDYRTSNYNFVGIMSFTFKFHAQVIRAPAPLFRQKIPQHMEVELPLNTNALTRFLPLEKYNFPHAALPSYHQT